MISEVRVSEPGRGGEDGGTGTGEIVNSFDVMISCLPALDMELPCRLNSFV